MRASAAIDGDDDARDHLPRPKPAPGEMLKAAISNTDEPLPMPIDDQIAVVKREIALRERLFLKWFETSKNTSEKEYIHQLVGMRCVLRSLIKLAGAG